MDQKTKAIPSEQSGTKASSSNQLGLEEIVRLAHRIGLEYVEAKQKSDHLNLMKASTKARIMNLIEDESLEKVPETKLLRLAESHPDFISYLAQLAEAKRESERLKVRYDSYKNLFEARRSMLSYQKAEMNLI